MLIFFEQTILTHQNQIKVSLSSSKWVYVVRAYLSTSTSHRGFSPFRLCLYTSGAKACHAYTHGNRLTLLRRLGFSL